MIPDIEYTPAKFTALKTPEKNLGRQEPDACPPGSPPGSLCGAHDSNDVAGEMGAGRAAALPRSDEPALRWGDRDSPRGGRRPPGGLLLQLPAGPAVSQSPRVCVHVCALTGMLRDIERISILLHERPKKSELLIHIHFAGRRMHAHGAVRSRWAACCPEPRTRPVCQSSWSPGPGGAMQPSRAGRHPARQSQALVLAFTTSRASLCARQSGTLAWFATHTRR